MRRSISKEKAAEAIAKIEEVRDLLAKVCNVLSSASGPYNHVDSAIMLPLLIDDHYAARTLLGELHIGALGVVTQADDIETLAMREADHMLFSEVESVPSVAYEKSLLVVNGLYANGRCDMCSGNAEVCIKRHVKGKSCP